MRAEKSIRALLTGGDRRSIGRADEVVALVGADPTLFDQLFACLWDDDPCVTMRAADATEKLCRTQPELFQPHKAALFGLLAEATQMEVRWHLALIAPRLKLTSVECHLVFATLQRYLDDRSSLVKTFALQGLADLLRQAPSLQPEVVDRLRVAGRTGTSAMRSRARILLKRLDSENAATETQAARLE